MDISKKSIENIFLKQIKDITLRPVGLKILGDNFINQLIGKKPK